jgi:hypothetical protein
MNYIQFCELIAQDDNEPATSFCAYFRKCLHEMSGNYVSRNRRVPIENRHFRSIGVVCAWRNYDWPATCYEPHHPGRTVVRFAAETENLLSRLRDGLQAAIARGNHVDALEYAEAILNWGMGNRGTAALEFLNRQDNAAAYLLTVRNHTELDQDSAELTDEVVPYCNAGLAKIHALASQTGLVIYDSRVAFAIGECVNEWLHQNQIMFVPDHLRFIQDGRRGQRPRYHNIGLVHPRCTRNSSWLQHQMRASWLIKAALEREPEIFGDAHNIAVRMHRVEAALFMFGAYANALDLPNAAI